MNEIEKEIIRRRDMREVLTFTIDPEDAKDFDDALSFHIQEDGNYQVGVHIADVTYYVTPGSDIDNEAYDRATSVYLVDRVIPMLPERLCNNICSLRPGEDKLCMSVIFTLGHDGKVLKYKICRTVIQSDYRLTYEQAQQIIDGEKGEYTQTLIDAIKTLNLLAIMMRRKRMADGALEIEQEETRFRLDEKGHPIEIYFHTSIPANHLIEEWMLLANRTIATHMGKTGKEMVYRVHDKPDEEKLISLKRFVKKMGDRVPAKTIDLLTVRAMAKAVYSTQNIGHYGLAFDYYTHFTSPIRRYPDMMVHRIVAQYILGERVKRNPNLDLQEACDHCSEMEQIATEAERDSIKEFQILWLQDHIDEEFDATIVNITEYGFFVSVDSNHCEGLVHIRTISPNSYGEFDEKNYCLRIKDDPILHKRRGWTSKTDFSAKERCYTLGDKVRVRLTRADLDKQQINFELVEQ